MQNEISFNTYGIVKYVPFLISNQPEEGLLKKKPQRVSLNY
jgi:hypothetical protein